MSRSCNEIIEYLKSLFPDELRESYDNTGLIIGSPKVDIDRVLVCLDITEEVVLEAIKLNVQLIVSHHPIIFKPIKDISYDKKPTSNLIKIINKNISIYSLHTNFDNACPGMNDILAEKLNLKNINKFEGGTGRYGELSSSIPLLQFAERVKEILGADIVRVSGDLKHMVNRIGVVGGAGSDFIADAINSCCDVLITGDVKHHEALDALDRGIALIDGSHYFTELIFIPYITELLNGIGNIDVFSTSVDTNPFIII